MAQSTKGGQIVSKLSALTHDSGLVSDIPCIGVLLAATLVAAVFVNTLFPFSLSTPVTRTPATASLGSSVSGRSNAAEIYLPPKVIYLLAQHAGGTVVDVRSARSFAREHVAGAINIEQGFGPDLAVHNRIASLAERGPVILYCDGGCGKSAEYVSRLRGNGIQDLFAVAGGLEGWKRTGLPPETEPATAGPPAGH